MVIYSSKVTRNRRWGRRKTCEGVKINEIKTYIKNRGCRDCGNDRDVALVATCSAMTRFADIAM